MLGRRILLVFLLFGAGISAIEQSGASIDPYSIGVSLTSHAGCPVFVLNILAHSPADKAGIRAGDQVLLVGAKEVQNANDAAQKLRSDSPGSVSVSFAHGGQISTTVIRREKLSAIYMLAGLKIISGVVVPPDSSATEVKRMLAFDGCRLVSQAFQSTHYPSDPALFYGGFELFLLRDPMEAMVGGIENGPAARAGVHWGDVVLTVNGQSTASQGASQLEKLLSSTGPKMMHLEVDRLGMVRTFAFHLEQAADIARQNQKRYVGGKVLPSWVSDRDLRCFE